MGNNGKPAIGMISWADLTVPNAEAVRDFYAAVVGWTPADFSMGDYSDYAMNDPHTGETRAGIGHARGENAGLPPQWLVYITVDRLSASLEQCRQRGGKVLIENRDMGSYGRLAVIQDPAGAVAALLEPPRPKAE